MAEQEARRRSGARPRLWIGLVAAVAILAAAAWLLWPGEREPELQPGGPVLPAEEGPGAQVVVLVFPDRSGSEWVQEERQLPGRGESLLEDRLLAIVAALCEGPEGEGAISAIPEGTRPLSAFYDDKDGSAVLDFSSELVTEHVGGSAAELATVTSILRTVALNFPEIRTCRILVAGDEIETLAGNLAMDHPFEPRRWL